MSASMSVTSEVLMSSVKVPSNRLAPRCVDSKSLASIRTRSTGSLIAHWKPSITPLLQEDATNTAWSISTSTWKLIKASSAELARTATVSCVPVCWNCRPRLSPMSTSETAGSRFGATSSAADRPLHSSRTVSVVRANALFCSVTTPVSFPTSTAPKSLELNATKLPSGNQLWPVTSVSHVPSSNTMRTRLWVVECCTPARVKLLSLFTPGKRKAISVGATLSSSASTSALATVDAEIIQLEPWVCATITVDGDDKLLYALTSYVEPSVKAPVISALARW
eukprot:3934885-Pleurochrysis_carterae.AAC.1